MSQTSRLFVALWPPTDVVAQIDRWCVRDEALRWQSPDRWHITLAFLGQRGQAASLRRFATVEVGAAEPVRLHAAGTFGQVLWLAVESGEWLGLLAARMRAGLGVTDSRFRAHVTVARARDAAGRAVLPQVRESLAGFVSEPWVPDEVTLVASTLGPRAVYEVIGRRRFEGA